MLLSDRDIKHYMQSGDLDVKGDIQCCSVDLAVETSMPKMIIPPGGFVLLKTKYPVKLPCFLAGMLGGRSRYAREGLMIHCTSALINPGFEGRIVLEVKNIGNHTVKIVDGAKICTLSFIKLLNPCENPYEGRYQGQ